MKSDANINDDVDHHLWKILEDARGGDLFIVVTEVARRLRAEGGRLTASDHRTQRQVSGRARLRWVNLQSPSCPQAALRPRVAGIA
jgi:hypothetical protein